MYGVLYLFSSISIVSYRSFLVLHYFSDLAFCYDLHSELDMSSNRLNQEQPGLVPRFSEYDTGPEAVQPDNRNFFSRMANNTEHRYASVFVANNSDNVTETDHRAKKLTQRKRHCGIPFPTLLIVLVAFIFGGAFGGGLGGGIARKESWYVPFQCLFRSYNLFDHCSLFNLN